MKVKLNTEALKIVTAKAAKGSGNLSMLAITSSIGIEIRDTNLILTTTDNSTNVEVVLKDVVKEPATFYVCTNSDLFCKLIAKQTSEAVVLEQQENCLQVTGDGVYNLPLVQDEEGTMGRITPIDVPALDTVKVNASELKKMLKYNKLAVSKQYDTPMYTGYCISDEKVYTFNGNTACITALKLKDINLLLPASFVELFNLFEDKSVTVSVSSNRIKFESEDVILTGTVLEGYDEYPTKPLADTVYSKEFTQSVKVSKNALNNILDRIGLFVSDKEQNAIQLNFGDLGLIISNVDSNACESVQYIGNKPTDVSSVFVDLNDLRVIVNTISTEDVTLIFGSESAIGVCTEDMRFVIPVLADDTAEEENGEN